MQYLTVNLIMMKMMKSRTLDIEEIKKRLPQRFPFLLLDRIIDMNPPERIVALKNISVNEPYFQGHFPGHSVIPGAIVVEIMAQTTTLFFKPKCRDFYLTSVKVRFLSPGFPGDQLIVEAVPVKLITDAGIFNVKVRVAEKLIARGELSVKGIV